MNEIKEKIDELKKENESIKKDLKEKEDQM